MKTMNILVVDDDPLLRTLLSRFLKDHGDVQVAGMAETGSEALRLAKESIPDIVIMDIELPDTDPPILIQKLRAISSSVRVYLCSAYPDEKVKTMVDQIGGNGFVSKSNLKESLALILQSERSMASG
jgi:DNA-binding NarL/FixJ family response regulator